MNAPGPALLLDENLSPRLVVELSVDYPGTLHLDSVGLHGLPDREVWEYARDHGFVLVSKDNDFRQMSFLLGAPPKVVWLRIGNAPTRAVLELLRTKKEQIATFASAEETALLPLIP
jgi:predicted nuclease of predicted toxin-antitoxin system